MSLLTSGQAAPEFELCFESLFHRGKGFAFPCDRQGCIDFNEVSERARTNYLFARAMVGREYAVPVVRSAVQH